MNEDVASVDIGIEQILAAILSKVELVELTPEELTADYSQYAVAVDPGEDGNLTFRLVDLNGVDLEEVSE